MKNETDKPILIYQMGKVGSTSVYKALMKLGISCHHLHYLEPRLMGFRPRNWYKETELILNAIRDGEKGWKIICPIREPISRSISAFFEKYSPISNAKHGPLGEKLSYKMSYTEDIHYLVEEFAKDPNFYHGEKWFDDHIKKYFGIDVFDYAFKKELGWDVIKDGTTEILIIQAEKLSIIGEDIIANFLKLKKSLKLQKLRQTKMRHPKTYLTFKRIISKKYLDEISEVYRGRYAQHFYSQKDISKFLNDWTELSHEKT